MALSVMKKVRMSVEDAALLKRLASERSVSEGEILRTGLYSIAKRQQRIDAAPLLQSMCDIGEESYVKFEGRI